MKEQEEKCDHMKEGSYRKICTICADENLCYFCVDGHECEPWKKDYVSKFIKATMEPARYKDVRDRLDFISQEKEKSFKAGLERGRLEELWEFNKRAPDVVHMLNYLERRKGEAKSLPVKEELS